MRCSSPSFAPSSRLAAAFGALVVALCANGARAAEPGAVAPSPAPAPAPAPASSSSTQVTAPAGNPVVVVNTTVPAPAPAPAPAPDPSWGAPQQPAVAPVPSHIVVDVRPQPMAPLDEAQLERSRRMTALSNAQSLRIGGWATLGSTYILSALIGTIAIDLAGRERIRNYGYWMVVPVAGPFGAAFQTRSATGALLTTALGAVQVAGLGMALAGGARYRRLKRELTLTAMPAPGGGHVGMTMRF